MTVSLSNRQYSMLRMLSKAGAMTIEEIGAYDQRCFRSMLQRGYCKWSRANGCFTITAAGLEAKRVYLETDIHRKVASLRLTSFFDMNVIGVNGRRRLERVA